MERERFRERERDDLISLSVEKKLWNYEKRIKSESVYLIRVEN